jgi:hypothetical protein
LYLSPFVVYSVPFASSLHWLNKSIIDCAVRGDTILWGARALGPRVINWTGLSCEDQVAILSTLLNTNNSTFLALADKMKSETTPLLLEGSIKAMTTKVKAFQKRKWQPFRDDELAEYDKRVEVWISSGHNIPKPLLEISPSLY